MQVTKHPRRKARGRDRVRSASSRKTACRPEPHLTGTRIWLCSSFRFLWTAQHQIYAAAARVRNHNPVTPMQNEERTCGYRRAPPERDRNDRFRQFRPRQIPRNWPSAGHFGLPGQIGNGGTSVRAGSSMRRRILRALVSTVVPEKPPKTSMKQGGEWQVRFQFHLPPVFRPSRSASLMQPLPVGCKANGAAHERYPDPSL
jgi:hypothetical protein